MDNSTRRTVLRIGGSALTAGFLAGCIGDSVSDNAGNDTTPTTATDGIEPTSGGDTTGDSATLASTARSAPDPTATLGTPVVSAIDTGGCPSASDGTFETSGGERSDVRPGRRAIVEFDRARNQITVHGTVITNDGERISSTSVTCADGTDAVELVIATESTIPRGTTVACGGYPLEYRATIEFDGSLPRTVVVTYRWPDGEPAFSTTATRSGEPRTTA